MRGQSGNDKNSKDIVADFSDPDHGNENFEGIGEDKKFGFHDNSESMIAYSDYQP